MATTAEVLGHHFETFAAGDLPGVLSDYGSDSILLTPNGTFTGVEETKAFFEGFMATLPEGFVENMVVDVQSVDGEYAYVTWHSGDAVPLGTDTFHVVDGKFAMQSFAAYMVQ